MAGERVSMSDIVREALDEYLNTIEDKRRTDIRSEKRTNENANG
jgi:Arc/MetJ-type ribon-helix-helix transcriptional regulator